MDIEDVIKSLTLKFTSGNDVDVTRATITRDEWEVIKTELEQSHDTKQDNIKHESGWTQEQYDRINQKLLIARISP